MANSNDEMVAVGQVYKERDGDLEVIPFHFDFGSAVVSFAPVGRSAEDKLSSREFLKRFEHFGAVSSMAEKQTADKRAAPEPKAAAKK